MIHIIAATLLAVVAAMGCATWLCSPRRCDPMDPEDVGLLAPFVFAAVIAVYDCLSGWAVSAVMR
ncbi:MAG: hypothetical protein U0990_09570 [Candidatus Nanopelagicales bacterium]|nr:hypothetical protein [Candidatus Nanopelagicales bacterium]